MPWPFFKTTCWFRFPFSGIQSQKANIDRVNLFSATAETIVVDIRAQVLPLGAFLAPSML
jgi:hypothetical protein